MKRLNPNHLPAALHTAKALANVALVAEHLTDVENYTPEQLVHIAAGVLGYDVSIVAIRCGGDPTVARALEIVRKARGVQS